MFRRGGKNRKPVDENRGSDKASNTVRVRVSRSARAWENLQFYYLLSQFSRHALACQVSAQIRKTNCAHSFWQIILPCRDLPSQKKPPRCRPQNYLLSIHHTKQTICKQKKNHFPPKASHPPERRKERSHHPRMNPRRRGKRGRRRGRR